MKILAVDDDEIILELLLEVLSAIGHYDAVFSTSGAQALEIISEERTPFDCILLDIQMPEMDGIELCTAIRSIPGYRQTPIIMVTAMSDTSYVDRAFAAGASDYVTKPFDVLELNTRLGLAEKLIKERRKVNDGICAVEALKQELNTMLSRSIKDPIDIAGVNGTIGYLEFENYLLQLTRQGLFFSSVFALKIANIEKLYETTSASEFRAILANVADAIADNLKFANSFLSYRGNGVFVCICHSGSTIDPKELEFEIQETLSGLQLVFEDGSPIPLDIVLGQIITPGVFAKPGSLGFLLKAVESAEHKCHNQIAGQQSSRIISQAVRDARQEPFDALLRESLQDGMLPSYPPVLKEQEKPNAA
jgi:CheY-like chemotaxis protein